MKSNKLTDNLLAQLFLEFQKDFKDKLQTGQHVEQISQQLGEKLHWALQYGHLNELEPQQKHKAYQVLDTVIQSMPEYQSLPPEEKEIKFPPSYIEIHEHPRCYHPRDYYGYRSDPWLTWWMLSNMSRPTHIHHYHGSRYPDSHYHDREKKKEDPLAQLFLLLLIGALGLSAVILTLFTLRELVECGDRYFHNEGTMRALISLSLMASSGLLGAFTGSVLLAAPLTSLAIAAGTSPVGVIIIASIALAMIGSGISALLFNQFRVHEYFIRKNNQDAIDPSEPERFSLTEEQALHLSDINLDVVKVKCAMVAIRNEMDSSHIEDKLWRMFTSKGKSQQKLLQQLQDLKEGRYMQTMTVGDMCFDLRAPVGTTTYYYQQADNEAEYQPQPYVIRPTPSAPPLEEENEMPSPFETGRGQTFFDQQPPPYSATNDTGIYCNQTGLPPDYQPIYPDLFQ